MFSPASNTSKCHNLTAAGWPPPTATSDLGGQWNHNNTKPSFGAALTDNGWGYDMPDIANGSVTRKPQQGALLFNVETPDLTKIPPYCLYGNRKP